MAFVGTFGWGLGEVVGIVGIAVDVGKAVVDVVDWIDYCCSLLHLLQTLHSYSVVGSGCCHSFVTYWRKAEEEVVGYTGLHWTYSS